MRSVTPIGFKFATLLGMLAVAVNSVSAQEMNAEQISCKLDPTCPKPGIRDLRGLKVLNDPIANPPNAATFHVTFAYDSAELTSDAMITLDQAGFALADPKLSTYRFTIAGHTDAKGSQEYNRFLSERRATSVRDYLVKQHRVPLSRLAVIGYGKLHLIDPDRPEDPVNRRVQLITNVR